MKLVVIETPFAAPTEDLRELNADYLKAAMLDSLDRGEAPYASHALYTQFLDDDIPGERRLGMEAGFAWGARADEIVVYTDLGISRGMREGIARALASGKHVEYRSLGAEWLMRGCGCPETAHRFAATVAA